MLDHRGDSNPAVLLPLLVSMGDGKDAINMLKDRLMKTRLLTLLGCGGIGKTRLALQVGEELAANFADGVHWLELASYDSSLSLPQITARVLGLQDASTETVLTFLESKHLLLVFDNCEHLLPVCAQFMALVLRLCPRVQILATSREILNIDGESAWMIPLLSVPDLHPSFIPDELLQYSAIRLFVERARAILPFFRLTSENARDIIRICRRLDGLPLAIELAVLRLKVLSLEQINERLNDCCKLLTGGRRSREPKHQAIKASLDWSYTLLSTSEQRLFRRLSVFSGSFTLSAVEAICSDEQIAQEETLDLLSSLINKSLVIVRHEHHECYYRLLEVTRQYSQALFHKDADEEQIRQRYCIWYLALAHQLETKLSDPDANRWLECLKTEYENFCSVLFWFDLQGERTGVEQINRVI
ncbi:MAG TPA: NB-ARC domain-containing protein, partial [Ktedonobacteraceae bacterium]